MSISTEPATAQPDSTQPGSAEPASAEQPDPAIVAHQGGKLEVRSRVPVRGPDDLALAYTPGVARACAAIVEEPSRVATLTWKSNTVAVVSDGTAVLGLGDIGPEAALPVMEGKALLFSEFAGINAVPICLDTHDVDELVETVARLAPTFGGINLEDIAAPRCFELERRLQDAVSIPVFHDDQHGTAIVVTAALVNGLRLTGRDAHDTRVVISGAGAAGVAVARMLLDLGISDIVVVDRNGAIHAGRDDLTPIKHDLATVTNPAGRQGSIADVLCDADVLVGVSGGTVPESVVATMAPKSIVFALANPAPEVHPDVGQRAGAAVVATGRSDFPNQINNVLAFPGIFRGALDSGASRVTEEMKQAAALAIADLVVDDLAADYVVPSVFDPRVAPAVAEAVASRVTHEAS